jgi:hypothetical protein
MIKARLVKTQKWPSAAGVKFKGRNEAAGSCLVGKDPK